MLYLIVMRLNLSLIFYIFMKETEITQKSVFHELKRKHFTREKRNHIILTCQVISLVFIY